jgi:hypothetical protein
MKNTHLLHAISTSESPTRRLHSVIHITHLLRRALSAALLYESLTWSSLAIRVVQFLGGQTLSRSALAAWILREVRHRLCSVLHSTTGAILARDALIAVGVASVVASIVRVIDLITVIAIAIARLASTTTTLHRWCATVHDATTASRRDGRGRAVGDARLGLLSVDPWRRGAVIGTNRTGLGLRCGGSRTVYDTTTLWRCNAVDDTRRSWWARSLVTSVGGGITRVAGIVSSLKRLSLLLSLESRLSAITSTTTSSSTTSTTNILSGITSRVLRSFDGVVCTHRRLHAWLTSSSDIAIQLAKSGFRNLLSGRRRLVGLDIFGNRFALLGTDWLIPRR